MSQAQAREALLEYVRRNLTERTRHASNTAHLQMVLESDDDVVEAAQSQPDEAAMHMMISSETRLKYKFMGADVCYRSFLRLTGEWVLLFIIMTLVIVPPHLRKVKSWVKVNEFGLI